MFTFSDYFLSEKRLSGYQNGYEQLEDLLRFADMLLEHFLDAKTMASEGLVFSRGLKMTEAETESYFFLPPRKRRSLGYDSAFATEAAEAVSWLESRVLHTGEDVRLPFSLLCRRFLLNDYEKLALLLALAVETDLKYARLFGYIAAEAGLLSATTGVAEALYATVQKTPAGQLPEIAALFSRPAALLFKKELWQEASRPLLSQPLVLHPYIVRWVLSAPCEEGEDRSEPQGKQPVFFEKELEELLACAGSGCRFCYIESRDERDAAHLVSALAQETGRPCLELEAKELLLDPACHDPEALSLKLQDFLIRAGLRAAPSGEGAPVLCRMAGQPADLSGKSVMQWEAQYRLLLRALDEGLPGGVICLCGQERVPAVLLSQESLYVLSLPLPKAGQRLGIWQACFKEAGVSPAPDVSVKDLADCYELSLGRIKSVVAQAAFTQKAEREGQPSLSREDLLSVLFRLNTADFSNLATRIPAAYHWDDIEMDEAQRQRLQSACDRFRLRSRMDEAFGLGKKNAYGNGVSVLLYGPPGTGKTMAAQVVANELGLLLYRVDVSQIFSKYIGETQKNLARIFEEAQKTNVILFFDEADALFAKRTEVKDSNDRHANAETAFLLQKVEEYNGLTILATNLFHQFDAAFVRRITYVVHMDSPDEETRLLLWRRTLPPEMPVAKDVDLAFLAKQFPLSGSNIKSILYAAAYMAGAKAGDAKEQQAAGNEGFSPVITMADIVLAMRYELEKMGRIIDAGEFGSYGIYLQMP